MTFITQLYTPEEFMKESQAPLPAFRDDYSVIRLKAQAMVRINQKALAADSAGYKALDKIVQHTAIENAQRFVVVEKSDGSLFLLTGNLTNDQKMLEVKTAYSLSDNHPVIGFDGIKNLSLQSSDDKKTLQINSKEDKKIIGWANDQPNLENRRNTGPKIGHMEALNRMKTALTDYKNGDKSPVSPRPRGV